MVKFSTARVGCYSLCSFVMCRERRKEDGSSVRLDAQTLSHESASECELGGL